ncbi:MAG: AEC family transporter [Clostridia bacterium]|nr:AEC family transporter [Clostridia bacterium]
MSTLLPLIFQLLFLMVLGFFLRKKRIIDDRIQKGLSEILLKAVLPFSILMSSNFDYSYDFVKAMIAVAGAAACYYIFGLSAVHFISGKLNIDRKERVVMIMVTIFANTGFMGFPIMDALGGEAGVLLASVYNLVFNAFFYTYGVASFSGKKITPQNLVMNMVTLSSIVAIIIFVSPFRIPSIIGNTFSVVADMATPLAMIIVGSSLATVDARKLISDKKSFLSATVRMVVFPAIMLLAVMIVRLRFYMMPVTAMAIVIMTSLPSGLLNVVLSEQHDCAPKFCVRTVFLTYIYMLLVLPVMMMLCTYLFSW